MNFGVLEPTPFNIHIKKRRIYGALVMSRVTETSLLIMDVVESGI